MKKTLFTTILLFVTYVANSTNYYVSNSGSDSNDGQSTTTAWQTIEKVNGTAFSAGDSILFERGGIWREELIITSSGTSDNYIVFATYGSGNTPRILGSNRAETWTEVQTNIWRAATDLIAPRTRTGNSTTNHPASIFFKGKDGSVTWGNMEELYLNSEGAPKDICEWDRDNGATLLDREYDWCWGNTNQIYVYCTENPGDRYDYIEVPQRESAISMNSHNAQEYVKIIGLELMYAVKHGIDCGWPMAYEKRGLTVRDCHIGFMGTKGAASSMGIQVWHSDLVIKNNDIHDCGRRNISYNVYGDTRTAPITFENVLIEGNRLHNGYHTTGADINAGYDDLFRNFVIRNNQIWDDPSDNPADHPNDFTSMGLYLNSGAGTYDNFQVYNNVFKYVKQKHIVANELNNSFIANNTFYGMNELAGGDYRAMINVTGEPTSFAIDNNIFVLNGNTNYVLSGVTFSGSSHTNSSMNNNLFYCLEASQRMVTINAGGSYNMDDWDDYKSDTGWETNSPTPADPQFWEAPNNLSLAEGSPARGAGMAYTEITTDILGETRNSPPSIGAYETGQVLSVKTIENGTYLVFPNPTKGGIIISNEANKKIDKVIITDLSGKIVLMKNNFANGDELDLSACKNGAYFLTLQVGKERNTTVVIKE